MFVEGDLNFRFDDETPSVNEHASPMNPSSQNYGHDRYHWGFEYKIVPLVHNLSQKGNDRELIKHNQNLYANEINIFDEVVGKAYKDDKEHTGLVTYITYKDGGLTPKYVWIIDSDDRQRYALYPKSCKIKDAKRAIKQNRFSPFTTNAYLSESVDLFADGDKYKYHENGEDEAYRLTFINLGINDMYLKAFDKMFIELCYRNREFYIQGIDMKTFCKLSGLADDDTKKFKKYINYLLKTYCSLTGHRYSDVHYSISNAYTTIKEWVTSDFKVLSWKDLYMLYKACLLAVNQVRMSSEDYKPKFGYIRELICVRDYKDKDFKQYLLRMVVNTVVYGNTAQYIKGENGQLTRVSLF